MTDKHFRHSPLVVSVEEAAHMLGVGRVTMYDLLRKNLIRSIKIGTCRRVVVASVHEYIERYSDDDDAA